MAERAELLGGRFFAGPDGRRGWRVEAELPRWP
jgi:signal transduction histidine kinase